MQGWIKLHRKLSDNPLWQCERFTRGQAWIDLILLTNHEDGYFYKRGVRIIVNRGQCAWSELALSKRWQWSRNKVRKFLKDLEKEHQIKQQKNNVTQIITINNYEKYQEKGHQKDTKRTPKGHQKDTNKNDKRMNKNEKEIYKSKFNNFEQVVSFFDSKFYNEEKWLDTYDKLIRLDKFTEDRILEIVKEFRADGNWWKDEGNFETLVKLRQKNKDGIKYIDFFDKKIKGKTQYAQI